MADASPRRTVGSAPSTSTSGRLARGRRLGPGLEPVPDGGFLAGRQLPEEVADGADQVIETVVKLVEALDEVHDPLVGPQRAGHQRLRGTLVHLDQPPVAQWPLRGQGVPGRLGQDAERQGKRGLASPRLIAGGGAQRAAIAGSNSIAAQSSRVRRSKRDRPRRSPSSSSAGGRSGLDVRLGVSFHQASPTGRPVPSARSAEAGRVATRRPSAR